MIKNVTPFFVDADRLANLMQEDNFLEAVAEHQAPNDLGPHQVSAHGWAPAFAGASQDVQSMSGLHFIRLKKLEKKLPGAAVKRAFDKEVEKTERDRGEPLSSNEKRELKENVMFRMLPGAPIVESAVIGYLDEANGVFHVLSSSDKDVSLFLDLLRQTAGQRMTFNRWMPSDSAERVMTGILRDASILPEGMILGESCKLEDQDGKTATFAKASDTLSDDVVDHLDNGMIATQLELNQHGWVRFKVDKDLKVRSIKFGDEVDVEIDDAGGEADDQATVIQATLSIEAAAIRKALANVQSLFDVKNTA